MTAIAPKCFSFTLCSLHWINYQPSCCYSFHSNQTKTSSLSSVEMTNTVIPMKKKDVSSHVGPGATFSGSFNKSTWMEERALFFLGTQNTQQFTRKHSSITLIKGRRDRSLNINRNIPGKYPVEAKKVKQKQKASIRYKINTSYTTLFRCIPWNILRITATVSVYTRSEPLQKIQHMGLHRSVGRALQR